MDNIGKKIQNESGYELTITADKMKAFVRPLEEPPPEVGPDSLKGLLETEGVLFGVSDDAQIIAYLASKPSKRDPWMIAQGKPVKPGRPQQIKYHFDIDPRKVGTVDESGAIDFKNRGEIPHVEEGELLAEIIPRKTGTPGRDIYGNFVQPPEYADIKIKHTEAGIQELQDDIRSLTELAKMKKHSATVNVSGTVHDQTLIEGPHASFLVKENLKHMSFQEVRRTDPNVEEEWVMIVSSLK